MSTKKQQEANMIDCDLNRIYHRLNSMLEKYGEDRKEKPISKAIRSVCAASSSIRPLMDKDERNATSW